MSCEPVALSGAHWCHSEELRGTDEMVDVYVASQEEENKPDLPAEQDFT